MAEATAATGAGTRVFTWSAAFELVVLAILRLQRWSTGADALGLFAVDVLEFLIGHRLDRFAVAFPDDASIAQPYHVRGVALNEIEVVQTADDGHPVLGIQSLEI